MKRENQRRIWAYAAGVAIVGGLGWFGWGYQPPADAGTLLRCAITQMELANGIPADSVEGREIRDGMLADAEGFLRLAEDQCPDHPHVLAARGDFELISGDKRAAFAAYGRAAQQRDCGPEQVELLTLRRAYLHVELDRPSEALAELDTLDTVENSQNGIRRQELRVAAHVALGDLSAAERAARGMVEFGGTDGFVRAGIELERLGLLESAEEMYRDPTVPSHVGEYCVARLKARQTDFDTSFELLKRALELDRDQTLQAIRSDREAWASSLESERFRELTGLQPAAPR